MPITTDKHDLIVREIAELLGVDESMVKPESSLQDDLGADSLDLLEICMALEDNFDIEISDEDALACRTVQQVFELVERLT